MRSNLPNKDLFLNKAVPSRPDIVLLEWKASGNDGHLYRAHSSTLNRDLACKIIPRSNLQHGPNGEEIWRGEVHKADILRNTAVVKFLDVRDWKTAEAECVVLIADFVEGVSLRTFLQKQSNEITIPFVTEWLGAMLDLLNEMVTARVAHGDLHAGNIMVEDRAAYALRGPRYVFRVTDFGVTEATSSGRFKDDFEQIADVLNQLLSAVDYQAWGPKDKYVFKVLRDQFVGKHLVEHDSTLDPLAKNPRQLYSRLQRIEMEFEESAGDETRLLTPFDFLSCEQIGDAPTLLRALYSERFLGLGEIESRNNVVVTGPRGCGKSTVFRSLSLEQKINIKEASPAEISYLGIYYRCDDLYFAFPRYGLPSRPEALDIPLHFVTATLLAKTLHVLETWAHLFYKEEFATNEASAAEGLWEALGMEPPKLPGSSTFKILAAELERQRKKAVEWQRFAHDTKRAVGRCFGAEILQNACTVLAGSFSFLRDRPFYFFIDDYSSPKVTRQLQLSLNRLFMQRSASYFFKLSTESPVSFSKSDIDEKIYVESREFILHNLGTVYLHADSTPKLVFLEDVFRRRLAGTQGAFPAAELEELVGTNKAHNNNEDARLIRDGQKIALWGKEILCHLCSGDIHYVISLVGDMVKIAGGTQAISQTAGEFKIPAATQNRAIREAAGGFLRNLRSVPKHGDQLVGIVEAFGSVAHSYLKFRNSKNEENSTPHQASRIEPYEPFNLSEEAQKLYDELLRYSVFIEDSRGKSRRGRVVPRLYLRRFLIPHFNLSFSTRDSVELEPTLFESFLLRPKDFETKYRLRSESDGLEGSTKLGRADQSVLDFGAGS